MSDKINYKSVFRILQNRYPSIAEELTPEPVKKNLNDMKALVREYAKLKKYTLTDVYKNKDESRIIFCALAVKLYDPLFFIDMEKALKYGLRAEIARQMKCHGSIISYTLQTVRIYMLTYKDFRNEVDYLYSKIIGKDEYTEINR